VQRRCAVKVRARRLQHLGLLAAHDLASAIDDLNSRIQPVLARGLAIAQTD
jgi:hypothetical protein